MCASIFTRLATDIDLYLSNLTFPQLTDVQVAMLDKVITVKVAMTALTASKDSGSDGLPFEIYSCSAGPWI